MTTSAMMTRNGARASVLRSAWLRLWGAVAALLLTGAIVTAAAQERISLIRDTEIERFLRLHTDPLLKAAHLDPAAVAIYLVNDNSINAFVSGGQNIFIHTGLIMSLETPDQLIGVIAHEIGHIKGGHIVRRREAIEQAAVPYVLSLIGGIAAMVAGAPDAGMGILSGGQHVAERSILAFTRAQESAADQAAVTLLEATGQSGRGMLEVFELFNGQELLTVRRQDPYARSHPMSRDRLAALADRVNSSPFADRGVTPEMQAAYDRIRAKLQGFLENPNAVLRRFPPKDQSEPARYARAVAFFRLPDFKRATIEIEGLLAADPQNPYYQELAGQLMTDSGKPAAAIAPYREAVRLLPDAPLLRVALAGAMLGTEQPEHLLPAKEQLEIALRQDRDNPLAWRYLAIIEEQLGQPALANLAAAEQNFAVANFPRALDFARRAEMRLPKGSSDHQRALDIIAIAQAEIKDRE